ncbi:hypothetical protein WJX74_008901 [Apatococcus lobatus]|uniref:Uncharacterized protein n=1 Tax=Apatococcus lobatus TaxID=904363 RepID=A0AAW1RDT1_9CHLO
MEQLLAILDHKISQERAEQLLEEADGSLDAAIAIFFSTAQQDAGNAGSSSSSQLHQLAGILGPGVPTARLRRLLSRAGSVPRAADLYFSEAGPEAEVAASAGPSQPESPPPPSSASRPRRRRRPTAVARTPSLTLDSDEEDPNAAPAAETAHASSGARTMETASSADLFQGFISALQTARGNDSDQGGMSSDDSDDNSFASDGSDSPGPPVMVPQIMDDGDDFDHDDAEDIEMLEQQEAEDAAGPSASGPFRGMLPMGQQPRAMQIRSIKIPSKWLSSFQASSNLDSNEQPNNGKRKGADQEEATFTVDASSDEEDSAATCLEAAGNLWVTADFNHTMLRACKEAKPAKALSGKRDPLKGWRSKARGEVDPDSLPSLLVPQELPEQWLHLGGLSFSVKAPWTPAQLEEPTAESPLFHFMAPSSRFTRPGWVPVIWPQNRIETLHWAQQDCNGAWDEQLRMLIALASSQDSAADKNMAAAFVDAGPLTFSFYCLLGMGLIRLTNMRLEHGEMESTAGSAAAEPEPAPVKPGKKSSKARPKSKHDAEAKGKAKAKAAAEAASAPLYLHLEVEMATSALCYQEPDGNVETETSGHKRKGRKSAMNSYAQEAWQLLLHHMLADPMCTLRLGPDCDAALNYCDNVESGMWKRLADIKAASAEQAAKSPTKRQKHRSGPRMLKLLDAVGVPEDLPEAPAPSSLTSQPKSYQLQGLQWMLHREQLGDALGRRMATLHPSWLQLQSADGHCFYVHAQHGLQCLSLNFYTAPIGGTCGGLLCDAMGLGKTLECLMLILANPPPHGWASEDLTGAVDGPDPTPIKTTLAVVPGNLLAQWQDEVRHHVKSGAMSWCVYTGESIINQAADASDGADGVAGRTRRSQRKPKALPGSQKPRPPLMCQAEDGTLVAMHTCDLCFITYEQLRKELGHEGRGDLSSTLLAWGFWRVLLDEAQLVAQSSSVAAQKASSLWRRHAWTVTGTPLSHRLSEIKGLLEFLAAEPFYHGLTWTWLLEEPYRRGNFAGAAPLMALLPSILLRRTKHDVEAQLGLPPCVHEDRWVPLSGVERAMYDSLHKKLDNAVDPIRHASSRARRRQSDFRTSKTGAKVMRSMTELRQACCHPQIVRRQDALLGQQRLSMDQILVRLTTQAFNQYDNALRAYLLLQAIHGAVQAHFSKSLGSNGARQLQEQLQKYVRTMGQVGELDIAVLAGTRTKDGDLAEVDSSAPISASHLQKRETEELLSACESAAMGLDPGRSAGAVPDMAQPPGGDASPGQLFKGADILLPARAENTALGGLPAAAANGHADHDAGLPGPHAVSGLANGSMQAASASTGQEGNSITAVGSKRKVQFEDRPGKAAHVTSNGTPGRELASAAQHHTSSSRIPESHAVSQTTAVPVSNAATEAHTAAELAHGSGTDAAPVIQTDAAGAAQATGQGEADQVQQAASREGKQEAKKRLREWQHLYLDALELLLELHYEMPKQSSLFREGNCTEAGPLSASSAAHQCLSLEEAEAEALCMREDLGLDVELSSAEAASMRYSRRTRGLRPEDELQQQAEEDLATSRAAQQRASNTTLREYDHAVKRGPKRSGEAHKKETAKAWEEVHEKWHALQHLLHKRVSLDTARKGKGKASAEKSAAEAAGVHGDDLQSCPICLDTLDRRTLTSCGHSFCTDCIRELVNGVNDEARLCPLCRTHLSPADLFDVVPDEEAAQQAPPEHSDYGSKTHQLLMELGAMRAKDPSSKAVVFSSWGRLLRLIGEALGANGIGHVSLAGTQPEARANALRTFLNDPKVMVITVIMSTGGGAAGLTLNVADTVFLMEPSLNPSIEAQAAARVHRLGQTKSTRVIRLLAEGTIEAAILSYQGRKLQEPASDDKAPATQLQELDPGALLSIINEHP